MGHPDLPLDRLAVAVTQCWIVLPMLLPLPVLLFPDGRRPTSRSWRATIWVYAAVCGMLLLGTAAQDAGAFTDRNIQVDDSGELLIFSQSPQGVLAAVGQAGFLVLVIIALSWVIRQVVAFRGSTGERRQQLKWLVSGGDGRDHRLRVRPGLQQCLESEPDPSGAVLPPDSSESSQFR